MEAEDWGVVLVVEPAGTGVVPLELDERPPVSCADMLIWWVGVGSEDLKNTPEIQSDNRKPANSRAQG